MPICPRCGKSLCTNQALDYHLRKKFKCSDNSCNICKLQFENRYKRDAHIKYCKAQKLFHTFAKCYTNVYVLDSKMNILSCNSSEMIDTLYNCILHYSPFSKHIRYIDNIPHTVDLEYVDDYIIAIENTLGKKCSAN